MSFPQFFNSHYFLVFIRILKSATKITKIIKISPLKKILSVIFVFHPEKVPFRKIVLIDVSVKRFGKKLLITQPMVKDFQNFLSPATMTSLSIL